MPSTSTAIKLPHLPDEIWFAIFEWATFVPNAFDVHAPDPFDYPGPWTQEQIQEGIRETMCTKRRLILVCRTWYTLASRYLYQAIPIFRPGTLKLLLRTLNSDMANQASLGISSVEKLKTWWPIRLDISLRYSHLFIADEFEDLLQYLSNLQVIVIRRSFPQFVESTSFFHLLPICTSQSLHVLDIACTDLPFHLLSYLPESIAHHPIRVLSIQASHLAPRIANIVLPDSLQHMDLLEVVFTSKTFPASLSHVSVDIHSMDLIEALSVHGNRLSSLELSDTCDLTDIASPSEYGFYCDERLGSLASFCPNLRSIVIHQTHNFSLLPARYLPPIEKLGIYNHLKKANSKRKWKEMCQGLEVLIAATPSLKVIRIIGQSSLNEFAKNHSGILKALSRFSEKFLRKHGVRFEDCTGQLFHSHVETVSTDKIHNKNGTLFSGDELLSLGSLKELTMN